MPVPMLPETRGLILQISCDDPRRLYLQPGASFDEDGSCYEPAFSIGSGLLTDGFFFSQLRARFAGVRNRCHELAKESWHRLFLMMRYQRQPETLPVAASAALMKNASNFQALNIRQ